MQRRDSSHMSTEPPIYALFKSQIAAHTGLEADVECEFVARAVLVVLSAMIPNGLREDIRAELPGPLQDAFARPPNTHFFESADEFFIAVAKTEHLPVGFAREHTGVVCQALVELLSAETLTRLVAALGPELGSLFRRRTRLRSPPKPLHGERETLSSGRPGGHEPIAFATTETRADSIALGKSGGKRPISEAHPGYEDDR